MDKEDQLLFYTNLSSIYAAIPANYLLFSGQDLNANLGTKKNSKLKCIGSYGLNNRNSKEKEAINILNLHNLYAPLTFFKHKSYTTWKSFDGHNRPYQLDQWICSSLNHIGDAKVVSYGIPSDHSAIKLKLKFKIFEKKKSEAVKIIDWNLLLDDDIKKKYNYSLSKSLGKFKNSEDINYTDYSNSIIEAANDAASTIKSDSSGWYNHSKHILQPLIDKRSTVLNDIRQLDYSTSTAKEMAKRS